VNVDFFSRFLQFYETLKKDKMEGEINEKEEIKGKIIEIIHKNIKTI